MVGSKETLAIISRREFMIMQRRASFKQFNLFHPSSSTVYVLIFVFLIIFLNGCTYSKYGRADITVFSIKSPEGLVGLTKSEIIDKLGLPEGGIIDEKGTEYWEYNNTNNFFLLIAGRGEHKSLVLTLHNNIVDSVRLVKKGSTVGLLTGGM